MAQSVEKSSLFYIHVHDGCRQQEEKGKHHVGQDVKSFFVPWKYLLFQLIVESVSFSIKPHIISELSDFLSLSLRCLVLCLSLFVLKY